MNANQRRACQRWMRAYVQDYVDECNEINCTAMVEAWDQDQGDGSTVDPEHEAWTIAHEVAEEHSDRFGKFCRRYVS